MIKSYTDINQSKKLVEFLPLESADMCYSNDGTAIKIDANPYTVRYSMWKDCVVEIIPCWSLAALLSVLPKLHKLQHSEEGYYCSLANYKYITEAYNNPVDVCYNMILKLHELNIL